MHNDRRGYFRQIPIYLGKFFRMFIYMDDWKMLPMAALIAGLVSFAVGKDVFVNMEETDIKRIVKYCKNNNITIVNITTDMENLLDSDYLIILYNKGIAMEGKTLECLKEEKILKRLGFNLPFMVDLSIQLGYYGLLNEIITNERKMIKTIWK